ncbi:hypothetical protein L6164_010174 [Bauhinia variegata]|uniref:Uncharacterized protein n=1 Tax=Bauhinia variegata TaxID=167791 RepID=A0ACB9PMD0_BAUVA|nr:hypothetical protein L6164_010174 [Bauhinia variegata]
MGNVDGVVQSDVKVMERPTRVRVRPYDEMLRFLGLALTLAATVIVGVDKETHTIPLIAGMQFRATAKWEYMSAFVYHLVSNAIACSYAAVSLVVSAKGRSRRGNRIPSLVLLLTTVDLVIMALLFSANGAAAAVGVIGKNGNSHVQWMKVCDVFDAYCRHMTTAIVLSLLGSTVFLLLVLLSIFKLHSKST